MAKKNKNKPFYYEGGLPEVGAKIVIQFHPEVNMTDIMFMKGDETISLVWIESSLDGASVQLTRADRVELYNVVRAEALHCSKEAGGQA